MTTKPVTIITIICATIITALPSNDDCADAKSITTFPHAETVDTTSATFDGVCSLPGHAGSSGNVWYVVSGVTGVLTVDTFGCIGAWRTLIRVFDSCISTCFAFNWYWAIINNNQNCAGIRIELVPADNVYIAVSGFETNDKGTIPVNFRLTTPPISNDNACNAEVVTIGQTISGTNINNSVQINEISPGVGSSAIDDCLSQDGWCWSYPTAENSLWFQVSAYILEIESSSRFDSQLAVYETTNCNDFSAYTEIAANDNVGPNKYDAVIKPIVSCDLLKHYLIQFTGVAGEENSFSLQFKGRAELELLIISDDPNNCWNRDLDDPMLLTATIDGSEEVNYAYQWVSTTGMAVDTGINNTLSIQPNLTTIYSVIITITDSYGCSTTSTNNITITSIDALSITFEDNYTTRTINTDSDTPITITGIVSGGSGQFAYEWHSIPRDISSTMIDNTLITSPFTTTKYNVTVRDIICDIEAHSGVFIIHVCNITELELLNISIISDDRNNCWNRDLDDPMLLTATIDGSEEVTNYTYAYQWVSTTGMAVDTGINNTLSIQPNITTTYSVIINITDSYGCSTTSTNNITITSIDALSITFKDNCTTRLINTDSDTPITITGIISGGSRQFKYEWHSIPTDITSTIIHNTLITSPFTTTKYNVTVRDIICGIEAHSGVFIIQVENIACNITRSPSSISSSSESIQAPNGILFCIDPSNNCTPPQCIANDRISIEKFKSKNPLSVQGTCANACAGQILCIQTRVQGSDESASFDSDENILFSSQKQLNGVEKQQEEEIHLVYNNNVIQANVDISDFFNVIWYGMLILCIVSCCIMIRKHLKMVWMK